jgi:hypothetical protein
MCGCAGKSSADVELPYKAITDRYLRIFVTDIRRLPQKGHLHLPDVPSADIAQPQYPRLTDVHLQMAVASSTRLHLWIHGKIQSVTHIRFNVNCANIAHIAKSVKHLKSLRLF